MNTETEKKTFDEWALVELMGHQRIVGRVTEQEIGGTPMLRVDVPDQEGKPGFTRFYSHKAVYAISPISEELARQMAANTDSAPVRRFELPALPVRPPEDPDDEDPIY